MLYWVVKYASGEVESWTEKGQKLTPCCGRFKDKQEMIRLYALNTTRFLYRSENKSTEISQEEFFNH